MHFNIILGFAKGSQSSTSHPNISTDSVKEIVGDNETVQQTAVAMAEQPHNTEGDGLEHDDMAMEEAQSWHNFD